MSAKITKTLRFDAELIRKAAALADQENRSLNNWIETLIMKEVKARLADGSISTLKLEKSY